MKLIDIYSQHRNDFTGIYECEHCGEKEKIDQGYDDSNYHENVIPKFYCNKCGKNRAGNTRVFIIVDKNKCEGIEIVNVFKNNQDARDQLNSLKDCGDFALRICEVIN